MKKRLIIDKKQPRTLKIETIESIAAQLHTVLVIIDRDLWHPVLCGSVKQLQAENRLSLMSSPTHFPSLHMGELGAS